MKSLTSVLLPALVLGFLSCDPGIETNEGAKDGEANQSNGRQGALDPGSQGGAGSNKSSGTSKALPVLSESEALAQFFQGISLMEQHQFKNASEAFGAVVLAMPKLYAARVNHGISLMNQVSEEAYTTAESELRRAIELSPNTPNAHYCLGIVLRQVSRLEEATTAFLRVSELDPLDARTQLFLGQMNDDRAVAKVYLEKALELDPYLESAYYQLMQIAYQSRDKATGDKYKEKFTELKNANTKMLASTIHDIKYTDMGPYADVIRALDPGIIPASKPSTSTVTWKNVTGDWKLPVSSTEVSHSGGPRGVLAREFGRSLSVCDIDGDGDSDLVSVVEREGLGPCIACFENQGDGTFVDVTESLKLPQSGLDVGALLGDVDSDGDLDLFIMRAGPDAFLRQGEDGTFEDETSVLGLDGGDQLSLTSNFADMDHDGDLDLFVVGYGVIGEGVIEEDALDAIDPKSLKGGQCRLYNNNGDGTFTDVITTSGIGSGAELDSHAVGVVFVDVDDDIDRDLLVFCQDGTNRVYMNDRIGRFHRAHESDLSSVFEQEVHQASGYGLKAADVNGDQFEDYLVLRGNDEASVLLLSGPNGEWTKSDLKLPPSTSGVFSDFDNDGKLDMALSALSGKPIRIFQGNGAGGFADVSPSLDPIEGIPSAISAADFDGDGDLDIVCALKSSGFVAIENEGGNKNNWIGIRLNGNGVGGEQPVAPNGTGTVVEVRAGAVWQRLVVLGGGSYLTQDSTVLHFGLGAQTKVDYIRMIWPDGVIQSESERSAGSIIDVPKVQRKLSSCPTLFTWDGKRFRFITDFMGGGGLGYFVKEGVYGPPDPTEVVLIEPGDLVQRNGRLLMRVAEPMEEISYVDGLELVAIDHPQEIDVILDERFWAGGGPEPTGEPLVVVERHTPSRAVDLEGRDLVECISAVDRTYPILQKRKGYLGRTHEHAVEMDFDLEFIAGERYVLDLFGWVEYGYSHDVFAAQQAGLETLYPSLEIPDGEGGWKVVSQDIGYPAGMPKGMAIDVTPWLEESGGHFRLRSNLEVYWDKIELARIGSQDQVVLTEVPLESAELRFLGYPREFSPDGAHPLIYDYQVLDVTLGFRSMSGAHTRFGDVSELISSVDDRFAIFGKGEEIALVYNSEALPELREGWVRSYMLRTDGYCKDMDLYTAYPDTVEPLPFRGMSAYPYPETESYPSTHEDYLEEYNTRVLHGR